MVTYAELKALKGKNVILVSDHHDGSVSTYVGRFSNLKKPEKEDDIHVALVRFRYNKVIPVSERIKGEKVRRSVEDGFPFKAEDSVYPYDLTNLPIA